MTIPRAFALSVCVLSGVVSAAADEVVFLASRRALGANLLVNPGLEAGTAPWEAWERGFERVPGPAARTGSSCVRLHSDSAEREVQYGVCQRLELDQAAAAPVIVEAWSKAEQVSGSADPGYSLYIDVMYADGTHLWSQTSAFPTGTHEWVRREVTIAPTKPIRHLLVYGLLRFHTGTVWFDDFAAYVPERGAYFDMALIQGAEREYDRNEEHGELTTPDGLSLSVGDRGHVSFRDTKWRSVQWDTSPAQTWRTSGFMLRDVAAQSDFVRPAVRVTHTEQAGARFIAESAALGLRLNAECAPGKDFFAFTGSVEDTTGADRAVSVYFAVPFPVEDAVWWDDVSASRPVQAGAEYGNWVQIGVGANGFVSRYPWCAISAPGAGLSLCVPPDQPQVMRMGWSCGVAYIAFDLGLSADASTHPRRADFAFEVFAHDPQWGFRDAARRVYAMSAHCFEKRVQSEGTWLITRSIKAIANPEDFFLKFHETGQRADPAGKALGIQSFRYVEPWRWRQRYAGKGTAEQRTKAGSLAVLEQKLTDPKEHVRRNSWAVKGSVCHDENGEPVAYIEDAPWGTSALFVCNADPAVARVGPESVNQADCYYSAAIAKQRYEAGLELEQDGEYIDSVEGFHWPMVQNYRREHFGCATYPLTFGTQSRRVCILNAFGHWAFLKTTGEDLHRRGKLMFGNALASRFAYFFTPYFDVLGTEHHWISRPDGSWKPESEARSNYRRALACQRPYLMLLNTDFKMMSHELVETYIRRCAFFGFFPSMFSHDAFHDRYFDSPEYYERDRDLFRRYLPIILDLAAAGWQPVTGARCSNPAVRLERFGTGKRMYLTVWNTDTTRSADAAIELVPPVLAESDTVTAVDALFAVRTLGTERSIALTLEPDDVAVLRLELE